MGSNPVRPTPPREIRDVIDCQSEIMLRLEIQVSKEAMVIKPFVRETQRPSTASVLRLVAPWCNSWRTIYGDSAFANVLTAHWLLTQGLHFIALVKTGHKYFPKQFFI